MATKQTRRREAEEIEVEVEIEEAPVPGASAIPAGAMGAKIGRPDEPPVQGPQRTGGGYPATTMTPEQLTAEGGATVRMNFPSLVNLTLDDRRMVTFPAGHNDVPADLVRHPYLKASGVEVVSEAPVREVAPAQAGHEAKTAPPPHKR